MRTSPVSRTRRRWRKAGSLLLVCSALAAAGPACGEEVLDPGAALALSEQARARAGEAIDAARGLTALMGAPLHDLPPAVTLRFRPSRDVAAVIRGLPLPDDITTTATLAPPRWLRVLEPGTVPHAPDAPEDFGQLPDDARSMPMPLQPVVPGVPLSDLGLLRTVAEHYRKGRIADGDRTAEGLEDPASRRAAGWAAIRHGRQALGFARIAGFVDANPDMPMAGWMRSRAEEALFIEKRAPEAVQAFFSSEPPRTGSGKVALARAMAALGEEAAACALVRDAYRNERTYAAMRQVLDKDFPGVIRTEDRRYLAERLAYDRESGEAARVAAGAGPGVDRLVQLIGASLSERGNIPALLAGLDPSLAQAPAALFARAQHFRRNGKPVEAAQALLKAPASQQAIVDGDEWWLEQRLLSRKLLDAGEARLAYRVAAAHQARRSALVVDAEVQAGWLALRYLDEPVTALRHFEQARAAAQTPASAARADYWRGRSIEAAGEPAADLAYLAASGHRHTYHGQLASDRLGDSRLPPLRPAVDAGAIEAATRHPGLATIRALMDAGETDLAQPLITDLARTAGSDAMARALGDLVARYGQPRLALLAGKLAQQQGLDAEDHAFPVFGIPAFEPVEGSAGRELVYAIARQESELNPAAISHAGARGLMQLMPATARRTASRFRIALDIADLTRNPALNARIGAAHLGELFGEYNGNYLLTFAAYNAGGRRVKEWIDAYGDPRNPAVDPIDWIERIPITETRHYIQKILENLQIYRARLTGDSGLHIAADLRRGLRSPKAEQRAAAPLPEWRLATP